MSDAELVDAYMDGKISRRTLIRRLVAAGVSLGAATAYAHHLAPNAAAKGSGANEYPRVKLRILSETTKEVAKDGYVRVRVKSADPCTLYVGGSVSQQSVWLGIDEKTVQFGHGGGKKEIRLKVRDAGDLNRKKRSVADVQAISDEGLYRPVVASKEKELEG